MSKTHDSGVIMVIDDTPANLRLLTEMLSGEGYRVLEFPRGELALRSALKNPPDLILLDILMPGMDGFEVCRKLKATESLRDIPVLFLSALDHLDHKTQAFAAGGVDYVTKPFQGVEVLARVKTHLNLHRASQQLERHNHFLGDLVEEKVKEISDSQMATILALSKLAEHRDDQTGQHVERARALCKLLAAKLSEGNGYARFIDTSYINNIYFTSSLHDIGKVGIPDNILLKPGKHTPAEFEIMKTHATIGEETLQMVKAKYPLNSFINMGIDITGTHHEKWDGSGYPRGLMGEQIPLSGRIMALADVYDALRSKRPYKEPFSQEQSHCIIMAGAGRHFDPAIAEAFSSLIDEYEQKIGHRQA